MNTPDESVSECQLGAWPGGHVDKDFRPTLMIDKALDVPKLVEVDATSVCVQWSSVPVTVHSTDVYVVEYLMSFLLEMQQIKPKSQDNEEGISEERWCTQYSGPATHVQVKGLHPGRKYALRVKCHPMTTDRNVQIKLAPPSDILMFQTKSTCPSAMLPPLLASRGEDFLNLKWSEPEENGGREISEYVLEGTLPLNLQDNAKVPINAQGMYEVYRGSGNRFTWRNLSPGVRYNVRVKAVNCLGEGAFSSIASFLTQASAPDAPSQIFCTSATSDSLTFEWLKPSGNGAEIFDYSIEMDDGKGSFDFVAKVQDCMLVLAKLQPDSEYTIRVRSENAKGSSPWSSSVTFRTLIPKPAAPENLSYVVSQGALIFSWQCVGDYQADMFILEAKAKNSSLGQEWKALYKGGDSSCEVRDIAPDLEYIVRVKSVNAGGESYSDHIVVVLKSQAIPSSINYWEDAFGNHLSWVLKRTKDSGKSIVFQVQVAETVQKTGTHEQSHFTTVYQGEAQDCLLEGLSPGIKYKARVRVQTEEGTSKWSNHVYFKPSNPACIIDEIKIRNITASSCVISWDTSKCAHQPKSFAVEIATLDDNVPNDFTIVYSGQETACTIMDLLPETAYVCRVRGEDKRPGPWSPNTDFCTKSALPNPPRDLKIVCKSKTEVHIDWAKDSCFEDVDYIQIEGNKVGHISSRPYPITCQVRPMDIGIVTSLVAGSQYSFRIRSGNSRGWGPWSASVVTTTEADVPARPGAPHTIPAGAGNAFKLSWEYPEDNGSTISDFEVATSLHENFDDYQLVYRGPDVSYRVTNLTFGSKFFVRVRAYNSIGKSEWSDHVEIRTSLPPPKPPTIVKAVVEDALIHISWQVQETSAHHAKCIGHEVEVNKIFSKSKTESSEAKSRLDKKSVILRKSCKRTETSCSFPQPEFQGELGIRICSVGEQGSGHGHWSEPYVLRCEQARKLHAGNQDNRAVEPTSGPKASVKQSVTTTHPHRKQRNINQIEMKVAKKPKHKDEMMPLKVSILFLLLLTVFIYVYVYF